MLALMDTPIELYDLAGRDPALRFSPYCWRARFALAHKGLRVAALPWRLHEGSRLAFTGQGRVPVLVDGERTVFDSWSIALYLDEHYADRPGLFGAPAAVPVVKALNAWADLTLNPAISRLIVKRVHDLLDPRDQPYFRESREARFGTTLEALDLHRETQLGVVREALLPIARLLTEQPFLAGESPAYADHIVAGSLMWPAVTAPWSLVEHDAALARWFDAMRDAYGHLGRTAVTATSA